MKEEIIGAKWVENGVADAIFFCNDEKPNIFLIGDSIRKGYCETVKNELSDRAEVFYFTDNCRSSQYVIFSMRKWARLFDDPTKVDVIQFNCGHWDVAHWSGHELPLTSEDEYAKNIQIIIDLLKKFFPRAKLIFATTTPMNPDGGSEGGINPRSTATIDRYNRIAVDIVEKNGVIVNDLNEYVREWNSSCYKDTCHYTDEAFVALGKEVARRLGDMLNDKQ